ncbi:YsgD/CorL family protein, partial [Klebsiella pneumoniae]
RTFSFDTPSRCWLNFLSFRNNS